jgi:hypothetical protein
MPFTARTTDGRRRFEVSGRPTQTGEPGGVLVIREIGPEPPAG